MYSAAVMYLRAGGELELLEHKLFLHKDIVQHVSSGGYEEEVFGEQSF
jgi:hypothetical protein